MNEDLDDSATGPLSDLQLALLQAVWSRGAASVAEVADALRPQRELAYTTVATLLTRLERRGLLRAEREGRLLRYSALVQPEAVQRRVLGGVLAGLFDNKPSRLLAQLMGQGGVSREELAAMRHLLARAEQADPDPRAPGQDDGRA